MIKLIFIILSAACIFTSCVTTESRKEYYYSFAKTTEAKIYKFKINGNENDNQYWKVTTIPESSVIITETYDNDLIKTEKFEEIITEKGAEVIGFTEYISDDLGNLTSVKTKVIEKDVYKWNSQFEYSYSLEFLTDQVYNLLTKTRSQSEIETIEIDGKEYLTATFNDEYNFKKKGEEQHRKEKPKNTFYQKTYYGKGIGVVKMERRFPDDPEMMIMELSEILTNDQFNQMLKL